MKSYGDVLKELRLKCGYDQRYVLKALREMGIETGQAQISRWENNHNNPNLQQFLGLCRLYEIKDPYLIFEKCDIQKDADLLRIEKLLKSLNQEGRGKAEEYTQLLVDSKKYAPAKPRGKIIEMPQRTLPLFDVGVSAGTGMFLDSPNYEMIAVPDEVPNTATFCVHVSGDSMEPTLEDGELLWVHQQPTLENGDIGIFLVNGDAYVKEYRHTEKGIFLISHNKKYKPIQITEYTEGRIFGKVVYPV